MRRRPWDAVNVVVSAPAMREPCTAPAAPASDCISVTLTICPKIFSRPSVAHSSVYSAIVDDGVYGSRIAVGICHMGSRLVSVHCFLHSFHSNHCVLSAAYIELLFYKNCRYFFALFWAVSGFLFPPAMSQVDALAKETKFFSIFGECSEGQRPRALIRMCAWHWRSYGNCHTV
jgi:hypothetical protein